YHNNGDGTFTNVTEKSGLKGRGWGADAAIFDYDGDGYIDVLITSMFGRSQLYRNNGNGTFTDVTLDVLGKTPWGGMGAHAFDFNNDGKLDLYIVDMHSDMYVPFGADLSGIDEKKRYPYVGGFDKDHPNFENLIKGEKEFADMIKLNYDEVVFGNAFFKA